MMHNVHPFSTIVISAPSYTRRVQREDEMWVPLFALGRGVSSVLLGEGEERTDSTHVLERPLNSPLTTKTIVA
eukprot:3519129-Pyramimonas_sp.AAC.1